MKNPWSMLGISSSGLIRFYENEDRTKFMKLSTDSSYTIPFHREFEHLKKLHSATKHCSYFPLYYECGKTVRDKNPYIIMEYIHGITLTEYLKSRKESAYMEPRLLLSWDKIRSITSQVYDALCILADNGILQYDLNTDNIIITEDGENIKVQLIDFTSCYYTSLGADNCGCHAINNRMDPDFREEPSLAILNATMLFFIRLFFSEDSSYFSYFDILDAGEPPTFFINLFSNKLDLVLLSSKQLKEKYLESASQLRQSQNYNYLFYLTNWFELLQDCFPSY